MQRANKADVQRGRIGGSDVYVFELGNLAGQRVWAVLSFRPLYQTFHIRLTPLSDEVDVDTY